MPDVTRLSGETIFQGVNLPTLDEIFDSLIDVVNKFFPLKNNSSYQPLYTSKGNIPAIVLAYIFTGLLVCEETNRGNRWFCRMIMKDESKTTQLGAAMSIAYFATRIFPWGVEMNKSAHNLTK